MILAQISDPHIAAPGSTADRAYQTAPYLQRAVDHLLAMPARPDAVLITGDCVDAGTVEEYERFRELIRPLPMPVYCILGNHDDRDNFRRVLGDQGTHAMPGTPGTPDFVQYVVDGWPVRLIALDTNIPRQGRGLLCEKRLRWLDDRLTEVPDRPALILLHHPPFPIGLQPLDSLGLEGADALGEIIGRHPNVERIVAGHVHCMTQRRFHGTLAVTCPSTAHQVYLDLLHPEKLFMAMQPPACLLHVWEEATGLLTHLSPIGDPGPVLMVHDGTRWVP